MVGNFNMNIIMKHISKIVMGILACITLISCSKDLLKKEHYKTEVYLVGAYDKVWTMDVKYEPEKSENFFTLSTSGSLNFSKEVLVEMVIDEEIITEYNNKFFGVLNLDKFYIPLPEDVYEIPDLKGIKIEPKNGIYKRVPIVLNTSKIDADLAYVVPIKIESVSEYEINDTGGELLIKLRMFNDYSGSYKLDGTKVTGEETPKRIQKIKNLKAISHNSVRLFFGTENELDDNIGSATLALKIGSLISQDDETTFNVDVTGWDALEISDASGIYNSETETFDITYTQGNTVYHEVLTKDKESKK